MTPILQYLAQVVGVTILTETALSYMGGGFGVSEPYPSWGNILSMSKDYLFLGQAWYPLLITAIISLSLSLIFSMAEGKE